MRTLSRPKARGDVERGSDGVHGWPQILSTSRSNDTVFARCLTQQMPLSTMTRSQRVVKIVSLCSGSWIISLDIGIQNTAHDWLWSYLDNRCLSINNNGCKSPLRFGVPQGSVLGSFLFTQYTVPRALCR